MNPGWRWALRDLQINRVCDLETRLAEGRAAGWKDDEPKTLREWGALPSTRAEDIAWWVYRFVSPWGVAIRALAGVLESALTEYADPRVRRATEMLRCGTPHTPQEWVAARREVAQALHDASGEGATALCRMFSPQGAEESLAAHMIAFSRTLAASSEACAAALLVEAAEAEGRGEGRIHAIVVAARSVAAARPDLDLKALLLDALEGEG